MREERTNRKTTSIARKIHVGYWFRRFFALLGLDIVILGMLFAAVLVWRLDTTDSDWMSGAKPVHITWSGESYATWMMTTQVGANTEDLQIHDIADYASLPLIVIGAVEIMMLISAGFGTRNIRRKLRPLNDLAVRAEALSNMSGDEVNLEHLEQAISNVSVDANDIRISTGDKDLQSIEAALNNLLARMQESKRQQARFVSDASHELRTPISVIQGYVNMLDRWGKEDEAVLNESIEALKNESDHMKDLIEQLLFLARGDSGRNTLKPVEVDLNDLVQEVYEESIMIDETHPYDFVACPGCMVRGDVAMLKQSIRIFVQNAAKYSDKGDTIHFTVGHTDQGVYYQVQDEGIGMQASEVVHIFERFYRSDEARNSETGGSGLGLSIAKWIVDAHDGKIDVLTRQDFGTRFRVTFPCSTDVNMLQ